MLLFAWVLHLLFGTVEGGDEYRAVVVNGRTGQPLINVRVLDVQRQRSLVTDEHGRFVLPGPVAHFRLQCLGFAGVEATRKALGSGRTDTLRLSPESVALDEVQVRPAAVVVLSSLGSQVGKRSGVMLIPGSQFGVFFRPAAGAPSAVLQQISVRMQTGHCLAGRLQVRVVAPAPGSTSTPGGRDLLPTPAMYTAAELAALPDHVLTVDVSAAGLRMPAAGLFVVIEGLPTLAGELYVDDQVAGGKLTKHGFPTIITAADPHNPAIFHETPAFDFPAIATAVSTTHTETVSRRNNKPWALMLLGNRPWDPGKNGKPGRTENVDIRLTLLPE